MAWSPEAKTRSENTSKTWTRAQPPQCQKHSKKHTRCTQNAITYTHPPPINPNSAHQTRTLPHTKQAKPQAKPKYTPPNHIRYEKSHTHTTHNPKTRKLHPPRLGNNSRKLKLSTPASQDNSCTQIEQAAAHPKHHTRPLKYQHTSHNPTSFCLSPHHKPTQPPGKKSTRVPR